MAVGRRIRLVRYRFTEDLIISSLLMSDVEETFDYGCTTYERTGESCMVNGERAEIYESTGELAQYVLDTHADRREMAKTYRTNQVTIPQSTWADLQDILEGRRWAETKDKWSTEAPWNEDEEGGQNSAQTT